MYLRSVGPALLVCLLLVWAMAYCSPQYDDTLMEILRAQGDAETLYAMHLDRPAMGWIFEQLDDRGWLWQGTILLNAIGWGIMATVACRLAVEFFPAKPAVAIAAGLLVVAPILVEMQFAILNNLIYIIAVPMLGLLLLLRPDRTRAAWVAALLATFALVALGGLVTEYVTAFGMAAAFVLVMLGLRSDARPDQMRACVAAATIAVAAIVGFIGLSLDKDPAFRPSADSSFLLADGVFRFVKLPFYLATVWYQVVGARC